jgi:2-polyprenyl-3-methyl-5-hydroxy-6-metoxy-1,4-benzoquinol methylase
MNSSLDSYNQWHDRVHGQEAPEEILLQQWHQDALKLAGAVGTVEILEVGCGAGDFSLHLAALGAQVTGTDFSPKAIEIAVSKGAVQASAARFQVADAQALPFLDQTFDLVLSCECLEHVPEPAKALAEMFRVLKPGGRLILTTENYSNGMLVYWLMAWIQRKPFNSGAGVQPIEHFFLYWRVLRLMRQAGFALLRMTGAHFVFLAVPGTHPHTFVRERIKTPWLANLLRPFARHISFELMKPTQQNAIQGK